MNPYFYVSLLSLVSVNVWHAALLILNKDKIRPRSLSEHATVSIGKLRTHRLVHICASVLLVFFALAYLLPHHYVLATWLLIFGAVFDVLEVLTLNKVSAARWTFMEPHFTTAWLMLGCYLMYAVVISHTASLVSWVPQAVWLFFIVLLIGAARDGFRRLWAVQMVYILLLACVVILAHAKLG